MSTIVNGEPVNKATPKNVVAHSTFKLDPHFFTTMRFGEYQPHCAFEGVPKDKISLQSSHEVRSYTLGSPLMSDVFIKKDYFCVPMQAVLPINWEKVYRNPKDGSDVNAGEVSTSVKSFPYKALNFVKFFRNAVLSNPSTGDDWDPESPSTPLNVLTYQFAYMLTAERFYSCGSLLANLGVNLSRTALFSFPGDSTLYEFDKVFDLWILDLIDNLESFEVTFDDRRVFAVDVAEKYVGQSVTPIGNVMSLRDFLTVARDGFNWHVTSIGVNSGKSSTPSCPTDIVGSPSTGTPSSLSDPGFPVNLGRCFAYQIACAHYFSNDNVDYIFSADLYRQNLKSLVLGWNNDSWSYFTYNGVQTEYDVCSAHVFNLLHDEAQAGGDIEQSASVDLKVFFEYLRLVFGFNRSLRFQDYFTGSRTRPLAVGNVGAEVVDSSVSAIDTTRSIQMQRFLNAVNRLPAKIESYLEGIFPGSRPRPDMHDPIWLGHTGDVVFGSEVENTGSEQFDPEKPVSVTSVLRGNASQTAFEFTVDRPCWIIGITYFDIPRSYYKGVNRILQHVDRFDMFNPFMQFVGDQPVLRSELDSYASSGNFAYTLRHMEYKQDYDRAAGGFAAGLLPGWTFLADDDARSTAENAKVISPDYIRSRPSEMDKFYLALSGWSLASYFHFIVKNHNRFIANRDMVYAPSIL